MILKNYSKILFAILLIFNLNHVEAQLSKTHFIPPLTSAEFGNANPEDQYFYISTPSATDVAFTIKSVGLSAGFDITGVVSNANPQEIYLDTGYGQLFIPPSSTSMVIDSRGYIIEAEDVIYVSARMNAGGGSQAGALVSKGLSSLGTTFRIGTYTNESPGTNYLNFVSVMATEDATQVTFSDLPAGLVIKNYPSGTTPVTTTLNKGESYTIAINSSESTANKDGLIGSLVRSDKPVVVNCGSANGSFHNGGGRDYGIDQIVGLSKVGNEYIFVKGDGENGWENVLIVPHTSGTTLSINGGAPITITGKYYLIEGDKYSADGNMYVETSAPVFAYQGVGATNGEANQGMFFVPPLSCENRGSLDNIAHIGDIGNTAYTGGVSIVTIKGATITINNQPLSDFSTVGPFNVPGKANYETYKVTNLTGNISVQSTEELYCAYFNYNGAATSGSFYAGFPAAPEINFDLDFETLGNCIPNVTLSAANFGAYDSLEWYYDDGSGFVGTGVSDATYTPTVPGTYKLIGIIDCTGLILESDEVPVSECPDDTDEDGIIDNIDIDNDNDGIQNCSESFGDQNIDLSNYNSGSLPVGNYTYTGTLTTMGNTAATPFAGDLNGTFLSEVSPKSGLSEVSVNYLLNFNNELNIKIEYASNTSLGNGLLTDDEEFIIKVPNHKTITLVDPDDQLLVDTNYDGVYESGITQFSSFEIHFKLNGTSLPAGTGTFQFLASMVDSFTYIHLNISETNSNEAAFNIEATCVPLDSDNDGNNDDFDNDSDNDGIPDIIEATGNLIILSGIDNDNNGLDDVFDINAVPIDTDTDGVFDYLDLDSDNDGVFDLEESGSGLPDTDFNGIIDDIGNIGMNGWENNAETTPDSGIIGYTVRDTDGNNQFNYINGDSDGDLCSDVIEAGFTPSPTNNNIINGTGVNPFNGLIIGSDGYTTSPHINYITAAPISITLQPVNMIVCDLSDTLFTIETTPVDTYQWEISTDNGSSWIPINDDIIYSGATTNELLITNTPLTFNSYQYRVLLEKNGNSCGLISEEVMLNVNPLPVANPVPDLELCDNLDDGDDTNGIVQSFDLESQTSTILGAQLPVDFTVTYHLNLTDASSGSNALTSPYENVTSPNQTIYVSVLNNTTNCRNTSLTFDLIVNALPIANPVSNLIECDNLDDSDDTNGIVQNLDLESQTAGILGTQPLTDYTVTYHLSSADAISGNLPLTSPHENNLSPNAQTIFVRIVNNTTGCVNPHLTFDVIVNELPIANTVLNLEECDNLDDSNDTNGIIQTWDLNSQTSTILGTQPTTDYTVSYHLNSADAISGNTPLSSPHSNNASPNSQTIYVRVLNNSTGCINTHLTFDVIVHPLPIVASPVTLKQCDDDTDGYSSFNLTEANEKISANAANENFTYYLTLAEAISRTNPIPNPTTFVNRTVSSDIVWASIESQFGCTREAEIQLFVSTTNIPPSYHRDFYQCDDFLDENGDDTSDNDKRDGIATFDFSSVDAEVRAFFPPGQVIVITYYRNEDDALAEQNAIQDISNYRNIGYPNSQDIYIRVDSELNNDCLGFGDHITLTVEELPFANPVTIERQCDDDDDGMYPFDISLVESTVLLGQTNVSVAYFDENLNALPSPLPNPFLTTSQTITIQVSNNNTQAPDGPCYDETTLEFIVDVSPVAYPVVIDPVCDDVSNDGLYDFDTSTIETTILGNQTNMEVHYFDENGTELSSPLPNPFTTTTQTISAQVINPLNTTCIATTSFDFIVNPLPNFEVNPSEIICITDPPSILTLSVTQEDSNEVLTYEWKDENGTIITNGTTADVSAPGKYYVTLIKTDGTLCQRTEEIIVDASIIATITQEDIIVEDDSDNNTITILTDNLGIGHYEYSLNDEFFGYQDEPFFDYVEPGIHMLYVRDKNGCGTSPIEASVIGYPKFLTPNDDGHNDTWNVIGINSELYPLTKIYIFDRFGKLIATISGDSDGWDGFYNGEQLPSTDYWFTAELIDTSGNVKLKKGHFSLIRR